jgi:hypothetical protein
VYHGRGREVDPNSLADWDLVLSTYHTVAVEALQGPLNQIMWFRIVLDEGMAKPGINTSRANKSSTRCSPHEYQTFPGSI